MSETFAPKDYLMSPEELAELPKLRAKLPGGATKKPKKEIDFYQFPKPVGVAIFQSGYMPALGVAFAIHETWFKGYQRNPITLTSACLGEFRISRGQKLRALRILEQTGFFGVKRFRHRSPLVTLKWLRITD